MSGTTSSSSFEKTQLTPVTEIFDPLTALAEVDFCFTWPERVRPIPGCSIRRLLDLGWLTEAEIAIHALPIDYESLVAYDSRPYYPWRPVHRGHTPEDGTSSPPYDRCSAAGPPPCDAERCARAHQVGLGIIAHDRRMAELGRDFSRAAREAELLELMSDLFAANTAREKREQAATIVDAAAVATSFGPGAVSLTPARSKRHIDSVGGDGITFTSGYCISSVHNKKKRRITPGTPRAGPSSWPRMQPRQFPAPAYAYSRQVVPSIAAKRKGKKGAGTAQCANTLPSDVDT